MAKINRVNMLMANHHGISLTRQTFDYLFREEVPPFISAFADHELVAPVIDFIFSGRFTGTRTGNSTAIDHYLDVGLEAAKLLKDPYLVAVAFGHDLFEDGDFEEYSDFRNTALACGLTEEVIAGITNLTRHDSVDYGEYIKAISPKNAPVKILDMTINLPTTGGRNRIKYSESIAYLTGVIYKDNRFSGE